jgi:hypothetical protein
LLPIFLSFLICVFLLLFFFFHVFSFFQSTDWFCILKIFWK